MRQPTASGSGRRGVDAQLDKPDSRSGSAAPVRLGREVTAGLKVRDGEIEIRAILRNPREGWAVHARRLAEQGGDTLVWPVVANEGDHELVR